MMDVKTSPLGKAGPVMLKASCKGCARAPVCQILRVWSEYSNKEFVEKKVEPPFPPERLAELCRYFLPTSAVKLDWQPQNQPNDMTSDGT